MTHNWEEIQIEKAFTWTPDTLYWYSKEPKGIKILKTQNKDIYYHSESTVVLLSQ